MKVTTEPGGFAAAVRFAAHALTVRAAYPVLGGLKITANDGGTVQLSAFDSETSARASIAAEASEPGTVLAPGRLLADIAARLPGQPVTLAGDDSSLTIECGSTRYQLRLLPLDDYPALPDLPAPAGHTDPDEFADAVAQVVIAASRDDTLSQLGAVQLTFTSGTLTLAATDRYRAAIRHLPWHPAPDRELPPPALIPAPAIAGAARITGSDRNPLSVHVVTAADGAPAVAGFSAGGQALTCPLLAGEYPDLTRMIPGQFSTTATLGAGELGEAIKRLAVVAARDTPVHLAFTPGQLELRAASADQADGTATLACELDGEPLTIAFHPRRLLDAITAAGPGQTRLHLTTPTRPALITLAPVDGQPDTDQASYRHLLMPIRAAG